MASGCVKGIDNNTRPGAHIIEDENGTLIGSFTRLTKVRLADFQKLLAEKNTRRPATQEKQTPAGPVSQTGCGCEPTCSFSSDGPSHWPNYKAHLRRLLLNALQDRRQAAPTMKRPLPDKEVILELRSLSLSKKGLRGSQKKRLAATEWKT